MVWTAFSKAFVGLAVLGHLSTAYADDYHPIDAPADSVDSLDDEPRFVQCYSEPLSPGIVDDARDFYMNASTMGSNAAQKDIKRITVKTIAVNFHDMGNSADDKLTASIHKQFKLLRDTYKEYGFNFELNEILHYNNPSWSQCSVQGDFAPKHPPCKSVTRALRKGTYQTLNVFIHRGLLVKIAATNISESRLFKPIKLGNSQLNHRIAMAPLTRYRHDKNHVAMPFVPRYYGERASTPGTLIISEATGVSMQDTGVPQGPAFVTDEQVEAWRKVIAEVHARKGVWFQQIWGQGRAADPEYQKARGFKYRSSSAVPMEPDAAIPEEMTEEEILQFIQDMVDTAKRVISAGGDGVEIHSAHGYLLDQFLSDSVNKRTDKWGGSVENRSRLTLEVVKAVVEAIGAEKVAIRLSPYASFQGAESSNIHEQYTYIAKELKKMNAPFAYLSLVEARGDPAKLLTVNEDPSIDQKTLDFILDIWDNLSPVIVAGGYTADTAAKALETHYAKWDVIVAFGRSFLANPDFVWRVKNGIELNKYHRQSFYIKGSEIGYNDYPFSSEYVDAQREWALKNLEVASK
ncbi:NADH: flavin oxidoreductase/NADH oxidase [Colletotrichum karsti]|uniref:NADH: flavin oxidoreductase/NADH oxidase n=1 Tax=Colletotrichum karsti TaxID=1095194 RepID=A0A9P6I292_9PEZI|nr:NADH: flavin oxidoreductase/NADH oxidase [Colletotrichum karsti]KAF9874704.1 NADH: flavin oxidoreductase/NADH oxidase [Colletotrichum karsti]